MQKEDNQSQRRSWRDIRQPRDPSEITSDAVDVSETRVQDPAHFDTHPRTPLLWLVVAHPLEQRGTMLVVQPGQIIGRKGEIHWRDPRVSRLHARFTLENDPADPSQQVYVITPQQDRNGTYVNGELIMASTPIYENDRIQIGDTLFVVKTLD